MPGWGGGSLRHQLPCLALGLSATLAIGTEPTLELSGVTVTPHLQLESMRYSRTPEPPQGARVQLFLRHAASSHATPLVIPSETPIRCNGKTPEQLLRSRAWRWHDTPAALPGERIELPPGALTVWTFNGRVLPWGVGGRISMEIGPGKGTLLSTNLTLTAPNAWLSAVTFLAPERVTQPDRIVVHVANDANEPLTLHSCRLWLPQDPKSPRAFLPQPTLTNLTCFGGRATTPAHDKGGFSVATGKLPLTYCALEVSVTRPGLAPFSLWAHLRIKPERFDISGGWVNDRWNSITNEGFLKTLTRLHVNTAHLQNTPGYTDTTLYTRYPLKYFNNLQPFATYDTDAMLPRIHAAEFLGEPQYGGGYPVHPQEVWRKLQPYAPTRLATSLTHSEERIWRDYAGLSDYPHYDAYRVSAPSADQWSKYDRWGGTTLRWGAPLETIGDMSRSLRELNRPKPCAYWSQGPHSGWEVYGGRKRTAPTPEEIRLQAYHAVSTRITSLYWFNLSLQALVQWRDTLEEVGRVGRELRLLDEFLLEGDAYRHERLRRADRKLDWDLASVCGPRAGLLFALDLDYRPDPADKVFRFGSPRNATWIFSLPDYLEEVADVFRLDANGLCKVRWTQKANGIEITDCISQVGIYVATPNKELRRQLEAERQELLKEEVRLQFDPARNDADFAQLARLRGAK
jgi:hypothetical protein